MLGRAERSGVERRSLCEGLNMPDRGEAPNPMVRAVVGWQASRIADPVERLRFLRRTVGDRRVWDPRTEPGKAFWKRRKRLLALAAAVVLVVPAGTMTSASRFLRRPVEAAAPGAVETYPNVWAVEQNGEYETYSNGLRVERRYEVGSEPRRYVVFERGHEEAGPSAERTAPAGIVFHTTESAQAEFAESQTKRLRIIGAALLEYIRGEKAYHYVVDRFGRVWRVVKESDAADHAGYSVWADRRTTYVNVNRAFLGVSVEATTQAETGQAEATPAQVHSLRVLTEMLRSKYRIAAVNCTTHAQVSVNPDNMQAGYHYDWAARFPYAEMGLPDNYSVPAPSLEIFGFGYDPSLVKVTGAAYWKGLVLGEEQLRQSATAHGMTVTEWRQRLKSRYRQILTTLKERTELSKEKQG